MIKLDLRANVGGFQLNVVFNTSGGITGLFGPSGAGKTSLMKVLAGLLEPDSGKIVVNDQVLFCGNDGINLSPRQRHVGYVSQAANLFPHLTVLRNLTYSQWAGRRKSSLILDDVCTLMGIEHLLERKPVSLSGGERQRVAIGRALLSGPQLLLMDEPVSALDSKRKIEVMELIEAIHLATKLPIVFISHSVEEIVRLADDVVVMQEGRVANFGSLEKVLGQVNLHDMKNSEPTGCLLRGKCTGYETSAGLIEINVEGQNAYLPGKSIANGERVRLWLKANDVALALQKPQGISIQNLFDCRVSYIKDIGSFHVEIGLTLGEQIFCSHITRKAAQDLELKPGQSCVALVKAVALAGDGLVGLTDG